MDQLAIGYIRTSHGVKGLLKVESFSGEREHFLQLQKVTLKHNGRSKTFEVDRIEYFGKGLLMKLQGIDTPEMGRKYSKWEIWVDRQYAVPLDSDEFYQADLQGCALVYKGTNLGRIKTVLAGGNGDLLEVELVDNNVKLVPFHREFIGEVDIKKQKIELLKDWVLE